MHCRRTVEEPSDGLMSTLEVLIEVDDSDNPTSSDKNDENRPNDRLCLTNIKWSRGNKQFWITFDLMSNTMTFKNKLLTCLEISRDHPQGIL